MRLGKLAQDALRGTLEVSDHMQNSWASPENPMKAFLYKTATDSLKDLPRKVAMVRANGTLDFAKGVS